jgi:hypothetical protein
MNGSIALICVLFSIQALLLMLLQCVIIWTRTTRSHAFRHGARGDGLRKLFPLNSVHLTSLLIIELLFTKSVHVHEASSYHPYPTCPLYWRSPERSFRTPMMEPTHPCKSHSLQHTPYTCHESKCLRHHHGNSHSPLHNCFPR